MLFVVFAYKFGCFGCFDVIFKSLGLILHCDVAVSLQNLSRFRGYEWI